ncbi:MAG: hypothetical protein IJ744_06015 [Lachnospiraceae bacterium]|nr:hypothetical protein [Lachnospiraceae bacterium]
MKKRLARIVALALVLVTIFSGSVRVSAANNATYTNAAQIAQLVAEGYNKGTKGPITITKGTLKTKGWLFTTTKDVYLVTLSGTEMVFNQSTEWVTDLFSGFNLKNAYYYNVVNVIKANVPKNANLVLAGHSLGGMIAQQVASDSAIKSRYNVLNTVCFGSPLLSLGSREGTVKRLGDVNDIVPYLSGNTFVAPIWAAVGLNREDGGYFGRPITGHKECYVREDVWGKYDVTGEKNGKATLTLDLSTRVFYQSKIIDW